MTNNLNSNFLRIEFQEDKIRMIENGATFKTGKDVTGVKKGVTS